MSTPGEAVEPLVKIWRTVIDGRTRESHLAAHGQARFVGEPFLVGGHELSEPRDPDGPPEETINCRCTMREYPLSQLPPELLAQIESRLTPEQRRFLNQRIKVADAVSEVAIPQPKPMPPERITEPSGSPAQDAIVVGVGERGNDVIIFYGDGTEEVRSGGTRSWRNNNPGNIIAGGHANSNGAIGIAGGMAVFPDQATGKAALLTLLQRSDWQIKTLNEAIRDYAPPQGGNPTSTYQAFVRNRLGKNGSEKLSSLTSAEINDLANAIIQFEGWRVGTVRYQKLVIP